MRSFREECPGCGHPCHRAGECAKRAYFTREVCRCTEDSVKKAAA